MVKQILYKLLASRQRSRALQDLENLEHKLVSPEARFAVPFVFRGKGYFKSIEPRQNPVEIEELYRILCQRKPASVLEIGTARGGTLYLWTQAASPDATLVSVDLPGGGFGGAYPSCRIPFYQSFAGPAQNIHLLLEDSHRSRTVQMVREIFRGRALDFLFIDGDHTYKGVQMDFVSYAPMVGPGGLIAFHDILPRHDIPEIEVHRFWQEIKKSNETHEIVGPEGSGKRVGIGLVHVKDESVQHPPAGRDSCTGNIRSQ